MRMTDFLAAEWKPALGCTEPAAVAWAAAMAAEQGGGHVRQVRLLCDPRTYKNCYAVGLPNSGAPRESSGPWPWGRIWPTDPWDCGASRVQIPP